MLKLALLGTGRIGQTHAKALSMIKGAKLAAVYDPITESAQAVAEQLSAKLSSYDEILNDESIKAVLICTPTNLHADQIEEFSGKGKAIFCEKPIDLSLERAKKAIATVKKIRLH